MIELGPMPAGGRAASPPSRSIMTERHVLALGLAVSAAFVVAAAAVAALTLSGGGSPWAAIHLALAGAASVAIGAFMPHFAVTLAGTRPAPAPQRIAALAMLGAGAALAVAGVTMVGGGWAALGAALMVGGLAVVAWQVAAPLRDPLARRHHVVTVAYGVALAELAAGIVLGGLAAVGIDAVIGAWATLRGAHAWLTLFGAVSLTIFATLVYLAPTVLGARIRPGLGLAAGTIGMIAGPILAVIGFAAAVPLAVMAGMLVTLGGALGQIAYVADSHRRRGRFTSEHDWRRVAIWHLSAGTGWFAAAVAVAAVELAAGRQLTGWSIGALALPMIGGWMVQELVGSWTHLAPSVTPGDAASHAAQRRRLAVASRSRLVAWNVAVGVTWIGLHTGLAPLTAAGATMLAAVVALSVLLLARALVSTAPRAAS